MSSPTDAEWDDVVQALRDADQVALACHVGPDGDALGSMLGLGAALRSLGKDVVASWGGEPFEVPDEGIGCGFTEAVRGVLSHHMVIRDGKIANYHPYPPTPWNASPRDEHGTPGPYEDAVQDQPLFEENDREHFKGIDVMRTVRSFDPCLPCGVHMYGGGKVKKVMHRPTGMS